MAEPGQNERELTLVSMNSQQCKSFRWKARTIVELDALCLQVRLDWLNDRIVLVVRCTIYASERIDAGKFLNETVQVTLKFHSTVPRLEGKPV